MPIIEIKRIPGAIKERIPVESGVVFSDFAEKHNLYDFDFVINGVKVDERFDVDFEIKESDVIYCYGQPLGFGGLLGSILNPLEHLNPIKFTKKILGMLIKQPDVAVASTPKESPNNKLAGQTNIARTYQARPDVYGAPVSYPDLIQQSIFEYKDNERFVTEWFNFGIGTYNVSRIRYSESPLSALPGSAYSIYNPGENIPLINEGFEFDDVDGQVIPGPNETDDYPIYTAETTNLVSSELGGGEAKIKIIRSAVNDDFDYFHELIKPHDVVFSVNVSVNTPTGVVVSRVEISATLTSSVQSDDGDLISPTFYYEFIFNNLSGNFPAGGVIVNDFFRMDDNEALIIGPFFAPIPGDQFWVHLQADLGERDYANTRIRYYKVDDNNEEILGTSGSIDAGFPAAGSSETFFKTVKITPSAGYGRYAFKFKRLENSNDHSVLRVEEIHSVRMRVNVIHANDTIITIETRATKVATGGRDKKFNAIINRKTISYNMATQSVDYTLRPSRSFADSALHTWLVIGGQPESSIDAYELYKIAAELPDERLGYFDFTFDDEDISLGARIDTICNAATVASFWDDGVLSFVRDDKKPFVSMLFNSSNTNTDSYSISYDANLPGGFEGVSVEYVNPSTNKKDVINLSIVDDGIILGEPRKAQKIELAGCRDKYQAMDRAILECRRLIYSRVTQSITALRDGNSVSVGQLVQYSDTFDENQQGGYIKSRNGDVFITSEKINFIGDMYVTVTDYLGKPTVKVRAYPAPNNQFGFTGPVPNVELNLWDGDETQSPSRYIIATQQEIDSTLWIVTEKSPSGDTDGDRESAKLMLVEYNEEMYDYQDLLDKFMQS